MMMIMMKVVMINDGDDDGLCKGANISGQHCF